jgi:hypothetical protein
MYNGCAARIVLSVAYGGQADGKRQAIDETSGVSEQRMTFT